MSFISYSQNNEDVLLWRALGRIKDGFYIDVGASDPEEHSVTKAFYDAGWRGINIEPLPVHVAAFDAQRPRDVNLAVAAGSEDGSLTLYDVPGVRGWASPEASVAELHRTEGHTVAELTVPVRTLASICAEYVHGDVHFLKIDVEGFEESVLRGMDFARWRPWVLVIEATLPNSRETNHANWEHLVTSQRYRFAWFDGLNRYYVADEHTELLEHFGIQPNVFDEYISHHLEKAWSANKEAVRALAETEQHADAVRAELHDMMQFAEALELEKQDALKELARLREEQEQVTRWAQDLEQRLIATLNSTSWKVTQPLRRAGALVHAVRRPGFAHRVLKRLTRIQVLRRVLIPILLRYPPIGNRVSSILQAAREAAPQDLPAGVAVPEEFRNVPASVRSVMADLRRARNHTHGN